MPVSVSKTNISTLLSSPTNTSIEYIVKVRLSVDIVCILIEIWLILFISPRDT